MIRTALTFLMFGTLLSAAVLIVLDRDVPFDPNDAPDWWRDLPGDPPRGG